MMERFPDPNAVLKLRELDPKLAPLIDRLDFFEVPLQDNLFESIASSIVGQQLSNRVAEVLWERLDGLAEGAVTPGFLLSVDDETLRQIGISYSKIGYLKGLAAAVSDQTIELERLHLYDDDEIMRQLTKLKGIGPWTAEMFLIFSMGRTDIFSIGDGGLQRAVKWLYDMDETPGKKDMLQISNRWKPYRTIAALYLWKALDEKVIDDNL